MARTSPGQAKITFTASQARVGPNSPCRPKISTSANPATTGETEKGTSNSDTRSERPGKRKRATSQAAATPKIVLMSTAMGATVSDSQMAWRVSGSWANASHHARGPLEKASTKTLASGATMSRPTVATAPVMRSRPRGLVAVAAWRGLEVIAGERCHWELRTRRCWRTLTTTSIDSDMPRRTTAIAVASA